MSIAFRRYGIGKTSLAHQFADSLDLLVHEIYLDSMYEMDITGYAHPNPEKGKFDYLHCGLFPLEGEELPINPRTNKPYAGHLILFDEFGNCPKSMQVAAQRVLLTKTVGGHKLHPKARIVLLGNMLKSGTNSNKLSAAIRTRCAIAELDSESMDAINSFIDYATKNKWHSLVVDWMRQNTVKLKSVSNDLVTDGQSPFLTRRALGELSDLMHKYAQLALSKRVPLSNVISSNKVMFQSMIGVDDGADFHNYASTPIEFYNDILTDPLNAQVPVTTQDKLKITNYLVNTVTTDDHARAVVEYLKRLDPEVRASMVSKLFNSEVLKNYQGFNDLTVAPF